MPLMSPHNRIIILLSDNVLISKGKVEEAIINV